MIRHECCTARSSPETHVGLLEVPRVPHLTLLPQCAGVGSTCLDFQCHSEQCSTMARPLKSSPPLEACVTTPPLSELRPVLCCVPPTASHPDVGTRECGICLGYAPTVCVSTWQPNPAVGMLTWRHPSIRTSAWTPHLTASLTCTAPAHPQLPTQGSVHSMHSVRHAPSTAR